MLPRLHTDWCATAAAAAAGTGHVVGGRGAAAAAVARQRAGAAGGARVVRGRGRAPFLIAHVFRSARQEAGKVLSKVGVGGRVGGGLAATPWTLRTCPLVAFVCGGIQ